MKTNIKYYFEIDCSGRECSRFEPRYSNYGTIIAEGNSLSDMLDTATVDIIDQDGGCLWHGPADEGWMQDLIEEHYYTDVLGYPRRPGENFETYSNRVGMELMHAE